MFFKFNVKNIQEEDNGCRSGLLTEGVKKTNKKQLRQIQQDHICCSHKYMLNAIFPIRNKEKKLHAHINHLVLLLGLFNHFLKCMGSTFSYGSQYWQCGIMPAVLSMTFIAGECQCPHTLSYKCDPVCVSVQAVLLSVEPQGKILKHHESQRIQW